MLTRRTRFGALTLLLFLLATGVAWALGFQLSQTKEELKLQYDVSVSDNGGGRATVTFTLADDGRIKPIRSVDLLVPSQDKSGYFDIALSLALREDNGKRVATVQLTRALVERAELHLITDRIDGKRGVMEWYYFVIPLAKYLPKSARN